ncbi:unnamed protein product [marine sediment metagenome]|uniref:Uncharacterized protein n=1 Tax=marine sediment metagenome TaxID=412755 RepID=X0UC77_9ZZZZ
MRVKNYIFQELKQFTGEGTFETEWSDVSISAEILAFVKLTAQGEYTDETLNISVQARSPDGDAIDLTEVKFNEIGNVLAFPLLGYLGFAGFGSQIRFKIVTTGTAPNYTFKLTGIGKR